MRRLFNHELRTSIVSLAILGLLFVGCGDDEPPPDPTTDTGTSTGDTTDTGTGTDDTTDTDTTDTDTGPDTTDTDTTDTGPDTTDTGDPPECSDDDPCDDKPCQTAECVEVGTDTTKTECQYEAVDCDDNKPCTVDSCDPDAGDNGECVNTDKICDDDNACTEDSCDTDGGDCVYTLIANCETCEDCDWVTPAQGCEWCNIDAECNVANEAGCITAFEDAVAAGDIEGVNKDILPPKYPSCMQPTCDAGSGKCILSALPGCCEASAACQTNACFFAECQPELAKPAHLAATTVKYCVQTPLEDCCGDTVDKAALPAVPFAAEWPNLPAGWSVLDQNPDDFISWHELENSQHCQGEDGRCLHLGYHYDDDDPDTVVDKFCPIYTNEGVDPATCEPIEAATCETDDDCPAGNFCPTQKVCKSTAVTLALAGPEAAMDIPDVPWALTFMLNMATEPPAGGLDGDKLTVVLLTDAGETTVFDSAKAIGNNTGGEWQQIAIDLSAWAGQTVDFEFRFDTVDEKFNYQGQFGEAFTGIFLDDVEVRSTCAETGCTTDAGCSAPSTCWQSGCVVFQPKTALSSEPASGFCVVEPVDGVDPETCVPCATVDDCSCETGDAICNTQGICGCLTCNPFDLQLIEEPFEGAIVPEDWTFENDPTCGSSWQIYDDPTAGPVLYFGQPDSVCDIGEEPACDGQAAPGICPTYECAVDAETDGKATSPQYDLKANTTILLTFDLLMSTEWDNVPFEETLCTNFGLCGDRLQLWAVGEDGSEEVVWDSFSIKNTTNCAYENKTVNVSSQSGKKVAFEFRFDSVDEYYNDFGGISINNFTVQEFCGENAPPCESETVEADCPVEDCQTATCVAGSCQYQSDPICCVTADDCTAGGECQAASCVQNEDGQGAHCEYAIDEDDVTCCEQNAEYWTEDFNTDGALPEGWEVQVCDGAPEDVTWSWSADGGTGGSGGLYFGNAATGTYDAPGSAVCGRITTPKLQVPPGGEPILKFDLFLSTEFDEYDDTAFEDYLAGINFTFVDRLAAYGVLFDSQQLIWRSDNGTPIKGTTLSEGGVVVWVEVAFSLKSYAGQKNVQIAFEFDSLTPADNAFGGVKIDNLRITQACPENPGDTICLTDADCDDDDACTIDACDDTTNKCTNTDDIANEDCCFDTPLVTYSFEEGSTNGWTVEPAGDTVRWHASTDTLANDGTGSLRFGAVGGLDYSSCVCTSPAAIGHVCDAFAEDGCDAVDCQTETGQPSPAGKARSPNFKLDKGKDYTVSFFMNPDLSVSEGPSGSLEGFTVKLILPTEAVGDLELVTLVCHAQECDDLLTFDPCKSGVNFDYPGCPDEDSKGGYGEWNKYSFKVSDVFCGAKEESIVQTFLESLGSNGSVDVFVELSMTTLDGADNCGSGLYVDSLQWSEVCLGWDGTCL